MVGFSYSSGIDLDQHFRDLPHVMESNACMVTRSIARATPLLLSREARTRVPGIRFSILPSGTVQRSAAQVDPYSRLGDPRIRSRANIASTLSPQLHASVAGPSSPVSACSGEQKDGVKAPLLALMSHAFLQARFPHSLHVPWPTRSPSPSLSRQSSEEHSPGLTSRCTRPLSCAYASPQAN